MEPLKKRFSGTRWAIRVLLFLLVFSPGNSLPGTGVHLRVGIYQNEPKIFLDEKGEPSGIFIDLLDEIARREGWRLTHVPCKWDHCLKALQSDQIDLMPDVAYSPERSEKFQFNKIPVIESWSQVYTLPENHIHGLRDLKGSRIALLLGSVQHASLEKLMQGFGFEYTAIAASGYNQAFLLVKQGIAQAAVSNNYFGENHISQYGLIKTPVIFDPVTLHFVSKKGKNPALIETIDRYLNDWIHTPNSFYYQCLTAYLEKPIIQPSSGFSSRMLVPAVLSILFLSALLFLWKRKKWNRGENRAGIDQSRGEEKNKFRSYVENAPFGVFVADENGDYLEVNEAIAAMTGYTKNELTGKSIRELIPEAFHDRAVNHFNRAVKRTKSSRILPFVTRNGERRYWSMDAVKISENRFLGFAVDVTRHYLAEKELRILKKKLESQVKNKTQELLERIKELEYFQEVTVERELRIRELQEENERLKSDTP